LDAAAFGWAAAAKSRKQSRTRIKISKKLRPSGAPSEASAHRSRAVKSEIWERASRAVPLID